MGQNEFFKMPSKIYMWVDDIRPMKNGFNTWVRSSNCAIKILMNNDVERISLDHDLGDECIFGNGYMVAKFIEEQAYFNKLKKLVWEIHSSNTVGVENMRHALMNADKYWEMHLHGKTQGEEIDSNSI